MSTRNKLYYPKSHVVNNLHTTGKEWMFENGTEYIGYYHKYVDGVVMSGAVFSKTESKKLIPYINSIEQPINYVYNSIKDFNQKISPFPNYKIPTIEDFNNGKFVRYFIKRRNYSTYTDIYEIDEAQFKLWKKPIGGIDSSLYYAIELDWKLTGPLHDTLNGINTVYGVYDTNKRIVELKDIDFTGIKDYLTDYIELTIYSKLISPEIKKQFGNLN
jgi:hypothetical protein